MAKRPPWLDVKPPDKTQANAFAIAEKNVPLFRKEFILFRDEIWRDTNKVDLLRAIQRQDVDAIIDAFPRIQDDSYREFAARIQNAYRRTIEQTGQREWDRLGISQKFSLKARKMVKPKKQPATLIKPKKQLSDPRLESFRVPLNEYSKNYIRTRSASLVRDINKEQRAALRKVLSDNFKKGNRPETVLAAISRTVGLTEIQAGAAEKRREALLQAGFTEERANEGADRYASQLLSQRASTIARTETNDAQNAGLFDSWRVAQENEYLPPTMRKEWVALDNSPRTSDICRDLDGQQVALDGKFYSAVLGEYIERPPAHPNCRSTVVLVDVSSQQ